MKLFRILLSSVAAVCLFASCETDLEIHKFSPESEYVAPALTAPGEINLTADAIAADEVVTFEWSAADFGQRAQINYNINASYNGNSSVFFASISATSYSVKSTELADKLVNLGVPRGQKVSISFNLDCTVGSNFSTLKSSDKSVSVFVAEAE